MQACAVVAGCRGVTPARRVRAVTSSAAAAASRFAPTTASSTASSPRSFGGKHRPFLGGSGISSTSTITSTRNLNRGSTSRGVVTTMALPPNKEWPPADVWEDFRANVGGEWEGHSVTCGPRGDLIPLATTYVPDVFKEYGVGVNQWTVGLLRHSRAVRVVAWGSYWLVIKWMCFDCKNIASANPIESQPNPRVPTLECQRWSANPSARRAAPPPPRAPGGSPPWTRSRTRRGGAVRVESIQLTHSLKAPGFNPTRAYQERNWFQSLPLKFNLYRYNEVLIPRGGVRLRKRGRRQDARRLTPRRRGLYKLLPARP
jgi:hypothetical protein